MFAAGVAGKSSRREGAKGQAERSGGWGEEEAGEEKSDMGGRDLEHWHIEMERRKWREDEGRKVTRSNRGREGRKEGKMDKWTRGVRDAADPPVWPCRQSASQLGCVHARPLTCTHILPHERALLYLPSGVGSARTHTDTSLSGAQREISRLSNLNCNQQIDEQTSCLQDVWSKRIWKGLTTNLL